MHLLVADEVYCNKTCATVVVDNIGHQLLRLLFNDMAEAQGNARSSTASFLVMLHIS